MSFWASFKENYKWMWNDEAYSIRRKELPKQQRAKRKEKEKRSAELRAAKGKPPKKKKQKSKKNQWDDMVDFDSWDL
jgi:hypothetical protein